MRSGPGTARAPDRKTMRGERVTSRGVEVAAPGKVNFILRVLEHRPDSYHNVWSVMQAFDLSDTVIAETDGGEGIRMTCEGADLPTDSTNRRCRGWAGARESGSWCGGDCRCRPGSAAAAAMRPPPSGRWRPFWKPAGPG